MCGLGIISSTPSQAEAAVLVALEAAGAFEEGVCDQRKCLFCTTEMGRSAMCRQLMPALHMDTSVAVRAPAPKLTCTDVPYAHDGSVAPLNRTPQYVFRWANIWHRTSQAQLC